MYRLLFLLGFATCGYCMFSHTCMEEMAKCMVADHIDPTAPFKCFKHAGCHHNETDHCVEKQMKKCMSPSHPSEPDAEDHPALRPQRSPSNNGGEETCDRSVLHTCFLELDNLKKEVCKCLGTTAISDSCKGEFHNMKAKVCQCAHSIHPQQCFNHPDDLTKFEERHKWFTKMACEQCEVEHGVA